MSLNIQKAFVTAILNMDIDLVYIILRNDLEYNDMSKNEFLKNLESIFESITLLFEDKFIKAEKGTCIGCSMGCSGYTFLTKNKYYLDFIISEKNNEIVEIDECFDLKNDKKIIKKIRMQMTKPIKKKNDETEVNEEEYPSYIEVEKEIDDFTQELKQFENDICTIDLLVEWIDKIEDLIYDISKDVSLAYNVKVKRFKKIYSLAKQFEPIVKNYAIYQIAMYEYHYIEQTKVKELTEWLHKYEDYLEEIYLTDKQKDIWKKSNFIIFNTENINNILVDTQNYNESIEFSIIYPKIHDRLKKIPF